jgi:hypothetical protein
MKEKHRPVAGRWKVCVCMQEFTCQVKLILRGTRSPTYVGEVTCADSWVHFTGCEQVGSDEVHMSWPASAVFSIEWTSDPRSREP